ncbi:unnamed protein product [Paramecium sonneborni]|uniref:Tetratricopeptide repeat protein n=1 Tax=Paramecium sonneborni TaxID=65129 RepID=A0A8S1R518_9CILI|nr:unnamed protein product [Paramecium sonneborni]
MFLSSSNNIQQFNYAQFESYLESLLKFDQNNTLVNKKVLDKPKLLNNKIKDTIQKFQFSLSLGCPKLNLKIRSQRLMNQLDIAMDWLKKGYLINPKHVLTLIRVGDCLRKQRKFQVAIKYYSEALSIDPTD